jgi:hypothetical protein
LGAINHAVSSIPQDIYIRVREIAVDMVNASSAGDTVLQASLYAAFRVYCQEISAAQRSHPFLTESLADFTDDDEEAVRLYRLAIDQAATFPEEHTHTKKIALARCLTVLGQLEQAEAYVRDAHAEAGLLDDKDCLLECEDLLREMKAQPLRRANRRQPPRSS